MWHATVWKKTLIYKIHSLSKTKDKVKKDGKKWRCSFLWRKIKGHHGWLMFVNTWDLSGRTSEEPATVVIMREATGDLGSWVGGNLLFTTHPAAKMLPSKAGGAGSIPGQGNKIPLAQQYGQKERKTKKIEFCSDFSSKESWKKIGKGTQLTKKENEESEPAG